MKAIVLATLSLAIVVSGAARDVTWHKGTIVLTDRGVVVGEIARMSLDLVLHRSASDGSVTSYPAHKVSSFRYYDAAEDINRMFISVARRSGVHKIYRYYESVVSGKISVLRIQHTFSQSIDESDTDNFSFFMSISGEQQHIVCPMKSFRRKFFPQVRQELEHQLISYRGLDPNTAHGALSLIILYNQSSSSSPSSVASLN